MAEGRLEETESNRNRMRPHECGRPGCLGWFRVGLLGTLPGSGSGSHRISAHVAKCMATPSRRTIIRMGSVDHSRCSDARRDYGAIRRNKRAAVHNRGNRLPRDSSNYRMASSHLRKICPSKNSRKREEDSNINLPFYFMWIS